MSYFNREGKPLTLEQWAELAGDLVTKRVAEDDLIAPDDRCLWVSTVWLGIDMSHHDGPPLIFESMVFERGFADLYCQRYATESEALAGHAALVHAAREGLIGRGE